MIEVRIPFGDAYGCPLGYVEQQLEKAGMPPYAQRHISKGMMKHWWKDPPGQFVYQWIPYGEYVVETALAAELAGYKESHDKYCPSAERIRALETANWRLDRFADFLCRQNWTSRGRAIAEEAFDNAVKMDAQREVNRG